ncbi:hypothetical protein I7I48_05321 [Histoplasma ohiense]|nr:hypothetical protein I7I48_05321 [Histoplasma ohiense (nom. inval.)]
MASLAELIMDSKFESSIHPSIAWCKISSGKIRATTSLFLKNGEKETHLLFSHGVPCNYLLIFVHLFSRTARVGGRRREYLREAGACA